MVVAGALRSIDYPVRRLSGSRRYVEIHATAATQARFQVGLIKLLIGNKAAGVHLSYIGRGSTADLCRRIADIGHTDVLVVTDKALKELGLAEQALSGLTEAGVTLHWYAGVDPDPTFAHVLEGREVLRSAGCTAIVAVGRRLVDGRGENYCLHPLQ